MKNTLNKCQNETSEKGWKKIHSSPIKIELNSTLQKYIIVYVNFLTNKQEANLPIQN